MRSILIAATLLLTAAPPPGLLPAAARAEEIGPLGPPGLPASAFPKPDRPVAEIVSPVWASERQRDAADEVGQVVRLLGIGPGQSVADLGAGSGYHTIRLARVVGPGGRVVAEDVTPRYLADLRRRVAAAGLPNVVFTLGEPHDPRLPPASVDVAILAHMYHEIAAPYAFLHNLAPALKPGARLGIIDLDRATWAHGTPRDLLRCELLAAGYREAGFHTLSGDIGYLAVFTAPQEPAPRAPAAITPCRTQTP